MVIVEGPDGGGKTTLVDKLCGYFGTDVEERPCTSENGIDMASLKAWVERDMARPLHGPGIYDRYPLFSEPIYGPLTRGRMADGFNDFSWLNRMNRMLMQRQPVVIWCLPPVNEVLENIERNHDGTTPHMAGVLRKARAIYDQYVQMTVTGHMLHFGFVWDYTAAAEEKGELFLHVCETIKKRKAL